MSRESGPDCAVLSNLILPLGRYVYTVSDALGDDFFEIFDVFLVETFFFSFSKLITLHGPTAAKKTVAPKKAIFCSLSRENNSAKKNKKK